MADLHAQPDGTAVDWWRQAVVYQIYPRSFADADADGIGDLPGITSRVPYLKALGVNAVWLSPFYPSGLFDGGYDVDDYRDVDPRLGSLADFDGLVAALHAVGIRLIVDIVPNHSSSRHPWFVEAMAAGPGSPARRRYVFRDGKGEDGEQPPSDWPSHFGGSAWTRVPDGQWYLHLFAEEQPDFDWTNPQVREDFRTTIRFWSDRGVDGFRVDVAHALAKDLDEPLRSNPRIETRNLPLDGSSPLFDRDAVHEIYAEWREVFDEYVPPRAAVAEACVPMERRVLYARPTGLGQAFNFDLVEVSWDAEQFRTVITRSLAEAQVSGATSTWVLSNHDIVRHASRFALPAGTDLDAWLRTAGGEPVADVEAGLRRARAATLLMLALPGAAYLYQGEELGLPEVSDLPESALVDPIWRRTGGRHKGRDGCRVPLPWAADGASLGFGGGGSHLPQPAWFAGYAVDVQDGEQASTLTLYRRALAVRRELLGDERLTWVEPARPGELHFRRGNGWGCFINFVPDPTPLPDPTSLIDGALLLASSPVTGRMCPGETTVWYRSPAGAG